MLGGLAFGFWRTCEILSLIPVIGMTAWFINGFQINTALSPDFILCLFIVSILACAWAICTLFRLNSTRRSALFVSFIDLCFVGAFIAAVVLLSPIGNADCTDFTSGTSGSIFSRLGPFGATISYFQHQFPDFDKNCAVLKASWAFGIMNAVFFFFTFILAIFLHRRQREVVVREKTVRRSRHSSRHGARSSTSRRRSSSRRNYYV